MTNEKLKEEIFDQLMDLVYDERSVKVATLWKLELDGDVGDEERKLDEYIDVWLNSDNDEMKVKVAHDFRVPREVEEGVELPPICTLDYERDEAHLWCEDTAVFPFLSDLKDPAKDVAKFVKQYATKVYDQGAGKYGVYRSS